MFARCISQVRCRARLAHRLPTINQVNRDQVELLRRFRACETR